MIGYLVYNVHIKAMSNKFYSQFFFLNIASKTYVVVYKITLILSVNLSKFKIKKVLYYLKN